VKNPARAEIVIDLGFGDSGKGLLTDALVRRFEAGLVVRFNGGPQAGHRVIGPDGAGHIFSQFASGLLVPGVVGLAGPEVWIHPAALMVEARRLEETGIGNPFSRHRISTACRVITPFHQAVGRLREIFRGNSRHGSCGTGLGEAAADEIRDPSTVIRASDFLGSREVLFQKLRIIRDRMTDAVSSFREALKGKIPADEEFEILDDPQLSRRWLKVCEALPWREMLLDDDGIRRLAGSGRGIILEGAQGVLLDQDFGFHPHTTWSRCTAAGAHDFVRTYCPDMTVETWGVVRSHAYRHGAGPLPTEIRGMAVPREDHNRSNSWQGPPRRGAFDAVLGRYALAAAGHIDDILLTHIDDVEARDMWFSADAYRISGEIPSFVQEQDPLRKLPLPENLRQQEMLGSLLGRVRPVLSKCPADVPIVTRLVEKLLGRKITAISRGPRAQDIEILTAEGRE